MAEDLGKRLLAEIEEVGLDEVGHDMVSLYQDNIYAKQQVQIFQSLRAEDDDEKTYTGLPHLDRLLATALDHRSQAPKARPTHPILELTSPASGGGKTHLLYSLIATAILPHHLHGRESCVVLLDTDGTFSLARLAQQLLYHSTLLHQDSSTIIAAALKHLHIFRPQSLASTIATLDTLPTYLFDQTRHYSFDRPLAMIVLDSASAFYWQTHSSSSSSEEETTTPTTTANSWAHLTTSLQRASATLSCPLILTSWSLQQRRLPAPLSQLPTLRMSVQRVPVRKFPVGISIEEARREARDRQQAVEEGKFVCTVNESGVDERMLQKLQRVGGGFGFWVRGEGVRVEGDREGG